MAQSGCVRGVYSGGDGARAFAKASEKSYA
jgi:hypothetical protein